MPLGDMGKRIREALDERRIRPADMARDFGISPSRLNNWLQGTNDPPIELLGEISRYIGRSINWVLGEPEGYLEVGGVKYPVSTVGVRLPSIGSASAGDWSDPTDTDDFEYLDEEFVVRRGQFICTINGDSMYDLLHPKDKGIWCKFENGGDVNHIVIARDNDHRLTVKQLVRRQGKLYLLAYNPAYKDKLQELTSEPIGYLLGYKRVDSSGDVSYRFNPNGIKP